MEYSATPYINRNGVQGIPFWTVLLLSIAFHLLFLVVLPLIGVLFYKPKKFERPRTFQLVTLPAHQAVQKKIKMPVETPKQKIVQSKPEPTKVPGPATPKPKTESPKPREQEAQTTEENTDELASLLDEIPAPAQVSAVGDFKYPWYLTNVQNKIQRYWNPPTENKNLKVIVSFTIYSDGTISKPKISKSSGDATLDNLALRAVLLAAPFGKLNVGGARSVDLNVALNPTRK